MSSSKSGPIRVGVAGLGRSGWGIHINAMRPMTDEFKVAAVLDSLEERRVQAAEEFGCAMYEKYEDLLADENVDLVVVAMPTDLHVPWAIKALEAGKDVVVEKPVSKDLAECDELIAAEAKSDKSVTVFQNRRYHASFLKMREVIESGDLGRVNFIRNTDMSYRRRWDWQTVKRLGGGALRNTGIHVLDQIMEFSGSADPEVFCKMDNVLSSGDAEDWFQLILTAPDAPTMEIDLFKNCAYTQDGWLVLGQKGSLTANDDTVKWKIVKGFDDLPKRELDLAPTADRSYNNEKLEFEEFEFSAKEAVLARPMEAAFYHDVYASLRDGAPQQITLAGVRRRMAVVDYCLQNCWV